jgi:hypothetical protein
MKGDGGDLFQVIKNLPKLTEEKPRNELLAIYSEYLWMNKRFGEGGSREAYLLLEMRWRKRDGKFINRNM